MKILPNRRGRIFLAHFALVGLLCVLAMEPGEGGILAGVLLILTFPVGIVAFALMSLILPSSPDSLLAQLPILAYIAMAALFASLAFNSWLWAWFFTRPAPSQRRERKE